MKGLIVAAPRSGGGKTTVALGLMRAFSRQGNSVAAIKCGPDYIDPAFHAAATGRSGLNLDSWAMEPDLIAALAGQAVEGADLAVGEGVMGLFDGVPAPSGRRGSTADIATALGWPVLLVLDVGGQSQTAAAVALGCLNYDPRLRFAGVVLNRVGGERHRKLAADAIEAIGLPVLGALPREPGIGLPERHLGLVQACETGQLDALLDRLATLTETHLDLPRIRAAMASQPPAGKAIARFRPPGQRIAIARDEAFSFLYPHLLRSWRDEGAEIGWFSPLADEPPPADCDVCWLPGGYPELHAGRLVAAERFLGGLRGFAESRPVHGECGGYMVLGRALIDAGGTRHAMAGLLDMTTSFERRRLSLGYRRATLLAQGVLGERGERFAGHEFHYATVTDEGADDAFALLEDAYGSEQIAIGHRRNRVTGSFFHFIAPYPYTESR